MTWWLMPRNPYPEVGGSSPTRVKMCCVLEQGTFTPQKVLVIPRKRWLRPNMTEKLFTWTLRINLPTNRFGVEGRILVLIASVPGHCILVTFTVFMTAVDSTHTITFSIQCVKNQALTRSLFNQNQNPVLETKRVNN